MIEGLNEFGYREEKKPFVFTEKTLYLHDQDTDIESREILFLSKYNVMQWIKD